MLVGVMLGVYSTMVIIDLNIYSLSSSFCEMLYISKNQD